MPILGYEDIYNYTIVQKIPDLFYEADKRILKQQNFVLMYGSSEKTDPSSNPNSGTCYRSRDEHLGVLI